MNKEDNIIRCQIKGTSEILLPKTMDRFMHQILSYVYLITLLIGKPIFIILFVARWPSISIVKHEFTQMDNIFIGKLLIVGNL